MGIIYKATNEINGKSYIGQTKKSLDERIKGHIYDSGRDNTHFHNSINKYGIDNFSWEILYKCDDIYLDFMEKFFIKRFDVFNSGYNLTTGGEGSYIRSEETKEKLKEKAKKRTGPKNGFYGKTHTENTKRIISNIHKNKIPWNKGKTGIYSDETIELMRSCKKGKKLTEEHKLKIKENSSGFKDHKHTDKTKEYLKNINLGRKHTKETREKMSEFRKGKKHTPETIRKMKEARTLYWKKKKRRIIT